LPPETDYPALPAPEEPVALVGFCVFFQWKKTQKPRFMGSVCSLQGKNRLIGDFSGFYARSATNCEGIT
jgi:hypothetical protein